jgi:hypothetical protein
MLVNRVFQPIVAEARTFRPFMERVTRHIGDTPLFFHHAFDNGAVYYANRHVLFYNAVLTPPGQAFFLLMWEEDWRKMTAQSMTGLRPIDISEGTGPKGNHRLMLIAIPAGVRIPLEAEQPTDEEAAEDETG